MSDMGMGEFAETSPKMADLMKQAGLGSKVFRVGEEIRVKESNFTIEQIGQHEMVLRLIPDNKSQQIPKHSKA